MFKVLSRELGSGCNDRVLGRTPGHVRGTATSV